MTSVATSVSTPERLGGQLRNRFVELHPEANVLPGADEADKAKRGARMSVVVALYRNGADELEFAHVRTVKNPTAYQPVGGGICPGESPREALVREVREELGLELELETAEYVGVAPSDLSQGQLTLFLAPVPAGEIVVQADEILELAWVPFSKVRTLPMYRVAHLLDAAVATHL